jgi:hypothetical protein
MISRSNYIRLLCLSAFLIAGAVLFADGVEASASKQSNTGPSKGPIVRDHRTKPIVRDHRKKPIIRDHRKKGGKCEGRSGC